MEARTPDRDVTPPSWRHLCRVEAGGTPQIRAMPDRGSGIGGPLAFSEWDIERIVVITTRDRHAALEEGDGLGRG
jgi:hypothetical protein